MVVEGNGDTNDKSIWERQIRARVADATEFLLSLSTIKNVMVSIMMDTITFLIVLSDSKNSVASATLALI